MSILDRILTPFRQGRPNAARPTAQEERQPLRLTASDDEVLACLRDGRRCFACGASNWMSGPRGGDCARNFTCYECGQGINYWSFGAQPIGVREEIRANYGRHGLTRAALRARNGVAVEAERDFDAIDSTFRAIMSNTGPGPQNDHQALM